MQSHYLENFERDMGCTEAEWLGWLPAALGEHPWTRDGSCVQAGIGLGSLQIDWQSAPPRRIALLRIPRLQVTFAFRGLDDSQRHAFMKRFDLYMQRGGG